MRLDLFLKSSRLCPRRPVAQKMCEAGLVSVNGHVGKPATAVKAGDELTLRRGTKTTTVRILGLPAARQTSRREAASFYEIIGEVAVAED